MVNWNEEQLAIFHEVESTKDNLIIEALAGGAKTTTLVELASRLGGTGIAVAFNKKIADELKPRLPPNVESRTLNSLGHRVWQQRLGRKLTLADGKCRQLLTEVIEDQTSEDDRQHLWENFADLTRIISGSKNHGHLPDRIARNLGERATPLMTDDEFFEMVPEDISPLMRDAVLSVLSASAEMALAGTIDFADQLLFPTITRCVFPIYQNVLVDEAQDLSELNHTMIAKFAKKRLIAVGDSAQAIYAFRGAHKEGMPLLAERFKMRTLHLSTSFRCPQAICDHVRWHVPRIQHWPDNPRNPGTIRRLASWDFSEIPDGAVVICRNNAPLFNLAVKMLREGRRPQVWGRDVAAALVKVMEGLGAPNMRREAAVAALSRYKAGKLEKAKKASAKQSVEDRCECILVFLSNAETLGGAISLAKNVLNSEGKVDLCSGHKSKGHEWENVFILDAFLLGDDIQDLNLTYVMATRSQHHLTYIESAGYVDPQA